jgi:hypothetical protein
MNDLPVLRPHHSCPQRQTGPAWRVASFFGCHPHASIDGNWRFDSPGTLPEGVMQDFWDLISRIVAQGSRRDLLEDFKGHFAGAAGSVHNFSSSESWASSDLYELMRQAKPALLQAATESPSPLCEAHFQKQTACVRVRPGRCRTSLGSSLASMMNHPMQHSGGKSHQRRGGARPSSAKR